jgi:riboflavin kinase/FMN adenylyltransferase
MLPKRSLWINSAFLPFSLPMIATTGFFDGVHLGHQALLHRVVQLAHQQGKKSAVITFRPHPREVLHHQKIPLLTSLKEKKKLIAAQGIDQIFVLPFTEVFAQLSAQQFFQTYLVNQFHITTLVIGHNHHIGKERADFSEIQRIGTAMGITVEGIEDVKKSGTLISSTQLRKKALRQKLLAQRSLIPPKQWETRTQSITQSVISLPLFKEAPEIYCYLDYHQEVGTRAIIQKAWEE